VLLASIEYNKTIHSLTGKKPVEVIHSTPNELEIEIKENYKRFQVGDRDWLKTNKRLGNKLSPLCSQETVKADLWTTVLIKGRVVHKDNLR